MALALALVPVPALLLLPLLLPWLRGLEKRQADGFPRRGASKRKRRLRRGCCSVSASAHVEVLVAARSIASKAYVGRGASVMGLLYLLPGRR